MTNRLTKIAFKQTIKKEWMDRTLELVCAGFSEDDIRKYLYEYLIGQETAKGKEHKRSDGTCNMAINMLSCWFRKDEELDVFRNALIEEAKKADSSNWLPLHMAIFSATYPFWFRVCNIVGKLFSYQDTISSSQVYDKMKSLYGDKTTIARDTKYAICTMISWGMITPVENQKGYYELADKFEIDNQKVQALIFEAMLLTTAEGKAMYEDIYRNPGLFKFQFDFMSATMVESLSKGRIHMINYGLTTEYLCLRSYS